MSRIVGNQDRTEFVLDPLEAWRRGRQLDRMLARVGPARQRGVTRATFAEFERIEKLRRLEIARQLNSA